MKNKLLFKLFVLAVFFLPAFSVAQLATNNIELKKMATDYAIYEKKLANKLLQKSKQKGWSLELKTNNPNQIILLTGFDSKGFPIYTATENNLTSATLTRTKQLWQGGNSGYNLSGSSANMIGKIAIWDGGIPSGNHIELSGKIVNKDGGSVNTHPTHVAGTLMANGIHPLAKGMAYNASKIDCYDFNNHISEIATGAANYLLSNHSYGTIAGWQYQFSGNWIYNGLLGDSADYKFGFYDADAQMLDSIAYNAPYYLIAKSAGNNRNQNGPAVGQPFQYYDNSGTLVSSSARPIGISNNDGYDIIPTYGTAKNIITIGAIESDVSVITKPNDIKISSQSSWGPTDDGRIKPDIVANGVNVVSCTDAPNNYASYSGTSMATPNITGSLFLLQELYSKKNSGNFMKAATLKALAIHTAFEAGANAGPDYQYGWGLLNAEKAAHIINDGDVGTTRMVESSLNNGSTYLLNVIASGNGKLKATIVWTDPVGSVTTTSLLNNPNLKLVNDLDIRIIKGTTTYFPWILNPAMPNMAATKGDNFRDNVEQVEIDDVEPGQSYTILITHKNTLKRGYQAFSLIVSGVGGVAYCNSAATQTQGSRIDSIAFAAINNNNVAGCTQYNNYCQLTAQLQPNTSYPLSIFISSCDASNATKAIKVYIDYNRNGSFVDAGEMVAASGLVTGNAVFATNILTPNNLTENTFSLMRVVMQETNDTADVKPCNAYLQGETQDYRVAFVAAKFDLSLADISLPYYNSCASSQQFVSARITNLGDSVVTNIPLHLLVKNGATTIVSTTENLRDTIAAGKTMVYTFQTPIATNAGANYEITTTANLPTDQYLQNNAATSAVQIAAALPNATGQAAICSNIATLRAFNTNANQTYLWFNSATTNALIAAGINATTTTIAPTYYIGSGISTQIGATSKNIFSEGDYQAKAGNYFTYNASVPMLLENARIYTAHAGTITITVADLKKTLPDGSYTYSYIDATTIDVTASRPIIARGNIAGNDIADSGKVYNINLLLPKGNHILIVTTDSNANIFRNNNIASNPYPYSIGDMFTITGNNATNPTQYYYYLYNMNMRTLDCKSDRVAVVPTIAAKPTVTYSGDSLVCSLGLDYQWRKDGVDIMNANNRTYKPIVNGNYSCYATDNTGCQQESNTLAFPQAAPADDILIKPNPANSFVEIAFSSNTNNSVQISIVDVTGKVWLQKMYSANIGVFNQRLNIATYPAGTYILNVLQGNTVLRKKFMVIR